ncbi:hypothetical protein Nos7107_3410 [Nostoc sp. PCC 7107]|nr:hypothetical protein Nos7107_3410 [Nostoc sp. PCC 7107]
MSNSSQYLRNLCVRDISTLSYLNITKCNFLHTINPELMLHATE